ncbi:MAG: hypothetical protein ACFFCV_03445 [Promethearchaeota archaeon]
MGFIKTIGKPFLILILIYVIIIPVTIIQVVFLGEQGGRVPLLGLSNNMHGLVFYFIVPLVFPLATVLLFSRFITPGFLKVKGFIYRRHKNAYLNLPFNVFFIKKFLKRGIYVFLLTLGLLAVLLPIIEPHADVLINEEFLAGYIAEGLNLSYLLPVVMVVSGMILPIVIGLWSIGWILEDSGLIHYSLKGRLDQLFEIEPVHLRYNSYLKGYAGISSIILLIKLFLEFASQGAIRRVDAIMVLLIPLFNILHTIPPYLLYGLVTRNYKNLIKGLPEAKIISEDQLLLKKEEE